MTLWIGSWIVQPALVLAPMAGVTDLPFRQLCKQLGAGLCISEMVSADPRLRSSRKTQLRLDHRGETEPRSVQIAGYDPDMMVEAAQYNVAEGAQIIDINMGCPAKKVCQVHAGSALLRDEARVERILTAVVNAVDVPVTLKIRTGWSAEQRNGVRIAQIAEQSGIQALAVHGRTRADGFRGQAEYGTIRAIKQAVNIPVLANGDIVTPEQAFRVLNYTGADGLMIGRGAQGKPWLFKEIHHYLQTGQLLAPPDRHWVGTVLLSHLRALYQFYGEQSGVRIARKHLSWYSHGHSHATEFWQSINQVSSAEQQLFLTEQFFCTVLAA